MQVLGAPTSIDETRILFVTGKGGVGKSVVAAGIALQQVRRGRKVLLVELGEISYYKDLWRLPTVTHTPTRIHLGFDVALWSGETCLREYVLHYLKVERLYKLFFENKMMNALINVAPGLTELAILGKVTSGIRKVGPVVDYDLIVVDTFATGHALALFRAPKGMQEAIKYGPMGSHSREIREIISNPSLTKHLIVTLLEELPVSETMELKTALAEELGLEADVAANKVLPLPAARAQIESLQTHLHSELGMREFCDYLLHTDGRQSKFIAHLKKSVRELYRAPLVFSDKPDEIVEGIAQAIGQGSVP